MEANKLSIISNEEVQHVQQDDHFASGVMEKRLLEKYEKHGDKEKVKFILNVEVAAAAAEVTGETDILFYGDGETSKDSFKGIDHVIESRAKYFAFKKYAGYGIGFSEFKFEFTLEALRLVKTQLTEGKEHYSYYERLQQSCEKRAIDLVRKFTSDKKKQERKERKGLEFGDIEENRIVTGNGLTSVQKSVEREATTNALIAQMIDDDALTDEEQSLLLIILEDTEGNNSSWGRSLSVSYHKVQRMRKKIAVKLAAYKEELVS